MRFQNNLTGVKFQIQELMITMGSFMVGIWEESGLGITLISLGILGAICRSAFEIAEKNKMVEAKNAESEKIKSATSALADAFSGFGSQSNTGEG